MSVITLGAGARPAHPGAEVDSPLDQRLDPQTTGQRRRQHDARIRDEPLVVEADRYSIRRHNHPSVVHHVGDLLRRGRGCPFQPLESPA
jgi:hypothetical protein